MDDIRAHLDDMALMYERLSRMGVTLHDEDYVSMVLMSLPDTYMTHLETLADSATSAGRTFTAANLISKAIELFDKRRIRADWAPKQGAKDVAFQSSEGNKHGKKGKPPKKQVECFNCHKLGHIQRKCRAPGGGKEGQPLPQRKDKGKNGDNSANTANITHDSVWSAVTTLVGD